jgi:hypothetical protein
MNKILIVVGAILVVMLLAHGQNTQGSYPHKYISAEGIANANVLQAVKNICDAAHVEASDESEQACGDAQDATGTEYLCSGPTANADCWVEVK